MIALSAVVVGLPGVLGLAVRELRAAPQHAPPPVAHRAPPSTRATAPGAAGGPH